MNLFKKKNYLTVPPSILTTWAPLSKLEFFSD